MSSANVMNIRRPDKRDPAGSPDAAGPAEPPIKRPQKVNGTKGKPVAASSAPATMQRAAPTGTVQMPFQVPAQIRREFKAYAAERDMTQSELFLRAWEEYRDRHS